MAQPDQQPTSALPAPPFSAPPFSAPPGYQLPPAAPTVRGQRLAWVLAILWGLLVVAAGVGGTIFAMNLSGWNQTIADQQSQIEALEKTEKSQQDTLHDRDTTLSAAIHAELAAKAVQSRAVLCRQSVSDFMKAPISDQAAWTNALNRAFINCQVTI